MPASLFAGSPRCTFTLIKNVAAPAVVLFRSSWIASRKMSQLSVVLDIHPFRPMSLPLPTTPEFILGLVTTIEKGQ